MKAKICILGDFSVGKSSLTRRLVENEFDAEYKTTLGVAITRHSIIVNNVTVDLIVWDLEGGKDSIGQLVPYLKGASGAVLVADVSRPETVEQLSLYRDVLLNDVNVSSVVVALNKADLVDVKTISIEDIAKKLRLSWSSRSLSPIFLTSAATGFNVDELFAVLCDDLLN